MITVYETRLIRLVQSEAVTLKLAPPRTREPTGCFRRQFLGTIQPSTKLHVHRILARHNASTLERTLSVARY